MENQNFEDINAFQNKYFLVGKSSNKKIDDNINEKYINDVSGSDSTNNQISINAKVTLHKKKGKPVIKQDLKNDMFNDDDIQHQENAGNDKNENLDNQGSDLGKGTESLVSDDRCNEGLVGKVSQLDFSKKN